MRPLSVETLRGMLMKTRRRQVYERKRFNKARRLARFVCLFPGPYVAYDPSVKMRGKRRRFFRWVLSVVKWDLVALAA
jgi:hypothetical protein